MRRWIKKKIVWLSVFIFLLLSADSYVLLKAFVLPQAEAVIATNQVASDTTTVESSNTTETTSSEPVITATSYTDENIQIAIDEQVVNDTTVYVVDIQVSDASYLKTALAQNTYGRNIKETTSTIAKDNQAILAINGDFYGFRSSGYVIRNGNLYRQSGEEGQEDLVIDENGDFSIVDEYDVSAQELLDSGVQQVLSFGPTLVENGEIVVDTSAEVGQSMSSNPRTAIGQVAENHYVMVVSDGRTDESVGLSLYQLAEVLQQAGAKTAYNLDGGGSSTLYFNGNVINTPVGGQGSSERSVSDIVYFGYE
ncbi:phosphodiester glycosidase family protein [Enterococcus saccharolyticus]|uniref:phosphodiester glycosidase family protein n=1 Tax=Enterococcus saccharolyticus TaxID=41997 RepID=UPI0039E04CB1